MPNIKEYLGLSFHLMLSRKVGRAAQKRRAAPKGRRRRPIRKGVGTFLVAVKKKAKTPLLRQIGKTALKKP